MAEAQARRTPRHFWIVAIVAMLWTLAGATDYTMLTTRNAWYLSGFTEEQIAHGESYPAWFVAVWTIAVWSGVLGAVLLLLRKKFAASVLLVSFLGWVVWAIAFPPMEGVPKDVGLVIPPLLALAWVIYAFIMARKRVLL